jgi:hypothetical protein
MLEQWSKDTGRRKHEFTKQAFQALRTYESKLKRSAEEDPSRCKLYSKYDLWTKGFVNGLEELEQSVICAEHYAGKVTSKYMEAMTEDEYDDYRRHLYFFKNAFIRIFSILDKLGYFLNDHYNLQTEKIKHRFSYYTVLRRFGERRAEPELERRLIEWKTRYHQPMGRLRYKRNTEIHMMNMEMLDDVDKGHLCSGGKTYVEDLVQNMADLRQGYDMVCHSLGTAFDWIVHGPRK